MRFNYRKLCNWLAIFNSSTALIIYVSWCGLFVRFITVKHNFQKLSNTQIDWHCSCRYLFKMCSTIKHHIQIPPFSISQIFPFPFLSLTTKTFQNSQSSNMTMPPLFWKNEVLWSVGYFSAVFPAPQCFKENRDITMILRYNVQNPCIAKLCIWLYCIIYLPESILHSILIETSLIDSHLNMGAI